MAPCAGNHDFDFKLIPAIGLGLGRSKMSRAVFSFVLPESNCKGIAAGHCGSLSGRWLQRASCRDICSNECGLGSERENVPD
jgi:hypothetical protein